MPPVNGESGIWRNNNAGLVVFDPVFESTTFDPVGPTQTYPAGTILARLDSGAGADEGKVTAYIAAAANGQGVPVGILATELTSDATPSDEPIRMLVSGRVKESELWHTAGAVSTKTTPLTPAERDALRDFSIVADLSNDFSKLDNGAEAL